MVSTSLVKMSLMGLVTWMIEIETFHTPLGRLRNLQAPANNERGFTLTLQQAWRVTARSADGLHTRLEWINVPDGVIDCDPVISKG